MVRRRGASSRERRSIARANARLRARIGSERGFGLIEVMVATTIGTIGILAVGGLQLAAATQSRIAEWRTGQALAAQQVFERINSQGYAGASSGSFSTQVDGFTYTVNVVVTTPTLRVKQLTATVGARGSVSARAFMTRIYDQRPVPTSP